MNRVARTDIRKFLGITETYGRPIDYYKKVEDPSYVTFTLRFNFGVQKIDDKAGVFITNGNLLTNPIDQPTDPTNSQTGGDVKYMRVNSAYEYLLAVNRPENARMLLEFINQLKDIQNNRPWTFQKLDGLDSCFKFDRTKIWQRKDAKIDVECLEYFDKQLLLLQSLYHNAVYDTEFNRFLLPKNFAGFGCDIIISEFNEKFEMTKSPITVNSIVNAVYETLADKNPFLREALRALPAAGEAIGGIAGLVGSGIAGVGNLLGGSLGEWGGIAQGWVNDVVSTATETTKKFLNKTGMGNNKTKSEAEWYEELCIEEEKKTNFKRPFTKATDDKLREEAHQRFLEAQNSTSGYDLVNSLLNSEGGRVLQSYIGDTGVNELIDTVRNVYNKAVKTYLRSLKDKFTYTTIHCEKCSFDFNPGFESYKTLSAGAVGEQVKSKFSILPNAPLASTRRSAGTRD